MEQRALPRYVREREDLGEPPLLPEMRLADFELALAESSLSTGSKDLARALVRLARPAQFPGGGVGLEYAPLLKTAARPDVLNAHVTEVTDHLHQERVDILFVPGMSGYPIGSMYAMASGIPAVLLKKQSYDPALLNDLPPGAFVIPSYTGNVDTVISADVRAATDIIGGLINRQLAAQVDCPSVTIEIRIGGADEIIDKATMATAITENAPVFVSAVVREILSSQPDAVAGRPVTVSCPVVAWVTPLLKAYGEAPSPLLARFGVAPFAGVTVSAIQFEPPAIGIAGVGLVLLEEPQ